MRWCKAVAVKPISFKASFPVIQSAIKITGDGGGMRIQLDIPESEMPEAVKLLVMRQMVLKVTVEPDEQEVIGGRNPTPKRSAAKRRE